MPIDPLGASVGLDPSQPIVGLDPLNPDPNAPGPFKRGFGAGAAGVKAALYGAGALAARGVAAVAPQPVADVANQVEQAALANVQAQNEIAAAQSQTIEQVDWTSPGSIADHFKYLLGNAAPSLLTMAAGGVIGRGAGAVASRFLPQVAPAALTRAGMYAGVAAPNVAIESGSIYPEALHNKVEDPGIRSIVGGLAASSLDMIPLLAAERYLHAVGKGGLGAVIKGIAKGAPVGATLEGVQETGQSVVERAAAGSSLTDEAAMSDYLNSFAGGAAPGAVIGGGIGGVRGSAAPTPVVPPPAVPPVVPPVDETPAAPPEPADIAAVHAAATQHATELSTQLAQVQAAHDAAQTQRDALDAEMEKPVGERRTKSEILVEKKARTAEIKKAKLRIEALGGELFTAKKAADTLAAQLAPVSPAVHTVEVPPAEFSAPAAGMVRMYHGESATAAGDMTSARWFSSDPQYAQGHAGESSDGVVSYVDIPADHPLIAPDYPEQSIDKGFHRSVELPVEIAGKRRLMPTNQEAAAQAKAFVDTNVASTEAPAATAVPDVQADFTELANATAGGKNTPARSKAIVTRAMKAFDAAVAEVAALPAEQARAVAETRARAVRGIGKEGRQHFVDKVMGVHGGSKASRAGVARPRTFYRGLDPRGDTTKRIRTGDDHWDSHLFASSKMGSALNYGKMIERIEAAPDAKILYQGTKEFIGIQKGMKLQGMSLLAFASEISKRAKAAGYDAVHFERQGDVGTAIINPGKFIRGGAVERGADGEYIDPGIKSNAALTQDAYDALPETAQHAAFDAYAEAMRAKGTALRERLTQLIGVDPNLVVKTFQANPDSPIGSFTRLGALKSVIAMALNAKDGLSIADHEGYHYAEDKLLTGAERRIVANALKPGRPLHQQLLAKVQQYDLENRTNLTDEVMSTPAEAHAYAFEFWRRGEFKVEGALNRIWAKVQQFFEKVANAVQGLGFKSMEGVFTALDQGQFAERQRGAGADSAGGLQSRSGGNRWYRSALTEAITAMNIKQATAQGWKDQIKGLVAKGVVKQAEIEAVGLQEFLDLSTDAQPTWNLVDKGGLAVGAFLSEEGAKAYAKTAAESGLKYTVSYVAPAKITKDAVMAFLGQNGVQVDETMLGDVDWEKSAQDKYGKPYADLSIAETAELRRSLERDGGKTKFNRPDLVLPGGQNYRELLLTLPAFVDSTAQWAEHGKLQAEGEQIRAEYPIISSRPRAVEARMHEIRLRSEVLENAIRAGEDTAGQFRSSHYSDTPNLLAHIRFNERTDAEGKKVLFIEEFQSDWAQKGKKEGFGITERFTVVDKNGNVRGDFATEAEADAYRRNPPEGMRFMVGPQSRISKSASTGIPTAPFVAKREFAVFKAGEELKRKDKNGKEFTERYDSEEKANAAATALGGEVRDLGYGEDTAAWLALSIKRMIRYAAENGFDKVAWTTGEQQVERYKQALRNVVDRVEWTKTDKGVHLVGYKGGQARAKTLDEAFAQWRGDALAGRRGQYTTAEINSMRRSDIEDILHEDYMRSARTKVVDTTEAETALSDAIGKTMAEKIKNDPSQSGFIEGDDITISDTGMSGFYDKIVPSVANDVLKKFGGGKVAPVVMNMVATSTYPHDDAPFAAADARIIPRGDNTYQVWVKNAQGVEQLRGGNHTSTAAAEAYIAAMAPGKTQHGFTITPALAERAALGLPLFSKGAVNAARNESDERGDPMPVEAEAVQKGIEGGTVLDAAKFVADTATSPEYRLIASRAHAQLAKLQAAGMKFEFKVSHVGDMVPTALLGARGLVYRPARSDTTQVWINGADLTGKVGASYQFVLHELLHAVTQTAIFVGNRKVSEGTALAKDVADLYAVSDAIVKHFNARVKAAGGDLSKLTEFEQRVFNRQNNALVNPHEVVSWALTNEQMQEYLESIPYGQRSMWSAFVAAVRRFLGLDAKADTVLSEVLRVSEGILNTPAADLVTAADAIGMSKAVNHAGLLHTAVDTDTVEGVLRGLTPAQRALYNQAAGQADDQIERQKSVGELQQEQANEAGIALIDQTAMTQPTWKMMMGGLSIQYSGGLTRWWQRNIATPNFASRFSQGYRNVYQVLNTYNRYSSVLIKQMLKEQMPEWYTAAKADQDAAFKALTLRNVGRYTRDSEEMRAILAPLTPAQVQMFNSATKMVEGFLRKELEVDKAFYRSVYNDEDYDKWLTNREQQVQELIAHGYEPLERYGDHTVTVSKTFTDAKGRKQPLSAVHHQFESAAAAHNAAEIYKAELARQGSDMTVEVGYKHKTMRDGTISIQQFLDTARRNGVPLTQAETERIVKALTASDSIVRNRMLRRKDVPGYSTDGMRILNSFGVKMSGKIAYAGFASAIDAAAAGRQVSADLVPVTVGNVTTMEPKIVVDDLRTDEATQESESKEEFESRNLWKADGPMSGFYRNLSDELSDYVLVPDHTGEWSRKLRAAAMMYFIGGSISGAMVNVMSIPMLLVPQLSVHADYTTGAAAAMSAWKLTWQHQATLRDIVKLKDTAAFPMKGIDEVPGLRRALITASEDGRTMDTEIHQITGMAQGAMFSQSRTVQKAMEVWMAPFRLSEQTNRITSFIAAYKIAAGEGVKQPDGSKKVLTGQDLYRFAGEMVDSTQNNYNAANRPGASRHPIYAMMFMFKSFPLFMTEAIALMYKANPRSAIYMLLGLTAMTGVQGLPFAETLMDIIDTISQRLFGSPFNTRRAMRNVIKSASEAFVGYDASELVMRGLINQMTGISVSSRIGAGDFIPGSRLGTADGDQARVLGDLLGAPFAMVKEAGANIGGAIGGLTTGDWKAAADALRAGGPIAVRNVIKGAEYLAQGYASDSKGRKIVDINGMEGLLQLGGFAPASVAAAYDHDRIIQQVKAFHTQVSADMQAKLVSALRAGDTEQAQEVYALRDAWNAQYPEMPIMPNGQAIRRALALSGMTLPERTLRLLGRRGQGLAADDAGL